MGVKENVRNGDLQHRYIYEYGSRLIPYFAAKSPMAFLSTRLESDLKVSPGYVVNDMVNMPTMLVCYHGTMLHVTSKHVTLFTRCGLRCKIDESASTC